MMNKNYVLLDMNKNTNSSITTFGKGRKNSTKPHNEILKNGNYFAVSMEVCTIK